MRQVKGAWTANRQERTKCIRILLSKGYDNEEAIRILDMRLLEYNPLGLTLEETINRTIEKGWQG